MKKLFIFLILLSISTVSSQNARFVLKGLGDSTWGMSYDQLLEQLKTIATDKDSQEKVEIIYQEKDKILRAKRNDIEYTYRFYTTPDRVTDLSKEKQTTTAATTTPATEPTGTATNEPKTEALRETVQGASLYSVEVKFNLVEADLLKYRLEQKFGRATKEVLDDKKTSVALVWDLSEGSLNEDEEIKTRLKDRYGVTKRADLDPKNISGERLWDVKDGKDMGASTLDGGYVVQWTESYKSKNYTRRVDYFSAKLMESISKDYKYYYSSREIDTLKKVIDFVERTGSGSTTPTDKKEEPTNPPATN
jgi:hypothetical protein